MAGKYERMVHKKAWSKIDKIMDRGNNREAMLEFAQGCAESDESEAITLLVRLINVNDREIKIAAAKAMGKAGNDTALSHIRRQQGLADANDKELCQALTEAADAIVQRHGE